MLQWFEWLRDDIDGDTNALQAASQSERLRRMFWPEQVSPTKVWPKWIPHREGKRGGYDNCGPLWPLENVWLGVSVENQATADERIPLLLQTPAAVRFLSCEPLLGAIDLHEIVLDFDNGVSTNGFGRWLAKPMTLIESGIGTISWLIAGGESGHGARPMHPDWARSLRDQCQAAGVPFFFKQWGEWIGGKFDRQKCKMICQSTKEGDTIGRIFWTNPGAPKVHLWEKADHYWTHASARVGKKAAGNVLDGRTWEEYPR